MVIRKEEQKLEIRTRMREGNGEVQMRELLPAERFCGHGRLFSLITLEPGCSIGRHAHVGESETFFLLQGTARLDDNGVERTLHAGDVAHTPSGESHAIENAGEEPLVLVAMIVKA